MLGRRDLCRFAAAAPLAFAAPAPAWTLLPVPDERVVLAERAGPTRVTLPARSCRIVASFFLAGGSSVAVRFAGQAEPGREFEVLAIIGRDRILAVEPWAGRATDGAHFSTRLDLLPGERGVILRRDAAVPNPARTVWRRQSWTDFLAAGANGLVDAPIHPPTPGGWQSAVAGRRAEVLSRLARRTGTLDPWLLSQAAMWPWAPAA